MKRAITFRLSEKEFNQFEKKADIEERSLASLARFIILNQIKEKRNENQGNFQ